MILSPICSCEAAHTRTHARTRCDGAGTGAACSLGRHLELDRNPCLCVVLEPHPGVLHAAAPQAARQLGHVLAPAALMPVDMRAGETARARVSNASRERRHRVRTRTAEAGAREHGRVP
jgi:hypothetical protein